MAKIIALVTTLALLVSAVVGRIGARSETDERALATEAQGGTTTCDGFGKKPCGSACCAMMETCTDASLGLCCHAGAPQCGGKCCGFGESCANEETGLCCMGGANKACGSKCCGAMESCVDPAQGTCCPIERRCGSKCCASSEFCSANEECLALTCQNLFSGFAKAKKGCSTDGTLSCKSTSDGPSLLNVTCSSGSTKGPTTSVAATTVCTSGDFKCYEINVDSEAVHAATDTMTKSCEQALSANQFASYSYSTKTGGDFRGSKTKTVTRSFSSVSDLPLSSFFGAKNMTLLASSSQECRGEIGIGGNGGASPIRIIGGSDGAVTVGKDGSLHVGKGGAVIFK